MTLNPDNLVLDLIEELTVRSDIRCNIMIDLSLSFSNSPVLVPNLKHPECSQIQKNDNLKCQTSRDTNNISYIVNVNANSVIY